MFSWMKWRRKKHKSAEKVPVYVLPVATLSALVDNYVTIIETGETQHLCKCLWRTHPDDPVVSDACRVMGCGFTRKAHHGNARGHDFAPARKARVDTHPTCPIHTKEGMILEFIKWASENG